MVSLLSAQKISVCHQTRREKKTTHLLKMHIAHHTHPCNCSNILMTQKQSISFYQNMKVTSMYVCFSSLQKMKHRMVSAATWEVSSRGCLLVQNSVVAVVAVVPVEFECWTGHLHQMHSWPVTMDRISALENWSLLTIKSKYIVKYRQAFCTFHWAHHQFA